MNPRNIWPAIVVGLGGPAVLGGLYVLHVDREFLSWLGALMLAPLLTALIMGQNAETKAAVQQVQQQTNGNTSRLMDILDAQGRLLAQMHPPAAGLPPAPEPDAPAPAPDPGPPA